jgi:hypothetical protein
MLAAKTNKAQLKLRKEEGASKKKEEIINNVYRLYSEEQRRSFIILKLEKLISSNAAAKQLRIVPRMAQRWWKYYEENNEVPVKKSVRNRGRESSFNKEYEGLVLNFIDEIPSTIVEENMDSSLNKFADLEISRSNLHKYITSNLNLSVKKATSSKI